jgi:F-type H+-transporting ATPase subunit a
LEIAYLALRKLLYDTMGSGPTREKILPYIFTLALYLPVANLLGLIGLAPPTSDYNVTLTLALITFVMTQYYGLRTNGLGGYVKGYFEPLPFLVPLNIVGELSNPISLSFRLFGNILSGGIIMGLVYSALNWLAPIAAPLHLYFDVFAGLIQTFIFIMLTMVFVGGNMPEEGM